MLLDRRAGPDLILFVHGLGCAGESFAPVWDHPALRGLSLLAPDLPGHGECPRAGPCTMQACARSLAGMLARHPAERVHLVGHSLGGAVGLLLAAQVGSRLASFVCAEGNLLPDDCGLLSRGVAATPIVEFLDDGFRRMIEGARADSGARSWAVWAAQADPRAFHEAASDVVRWSDSGELLARFLALPVPRTYLCGARSRLRTVTDRLGDVPVVEIPDAGHGLFEDQPDIVCRWLGAWLRGCAS
jgi:pimeloyl-ACP methyl ester carboxylesterase